MVEEYATHLEGWIQSCNENHGDICQVDPIVERPPHHIPDWVIDTEDGCIVRGCSVQRYVALSYVWSCAGEDDGGGGAAAEDRLILQKGNLDEFCRQGFLRTHVLERVPVVIQDAMDFVQLSGFRYLWVDSLCIVQHDGTTRDRIGLMNEIYSGASFTIIAAASTKRLFGNKHGPSPYEWITEQDLHSDLLSSYWASRGWTFQEQLLSKRSIVFLDYVCFWDCQREVQWPRPSMNEDTDSPLPYMGRLVRLLRDWQPPPNSRHPFEKGALGRARRKIIRGDESQGPKSLSSVPDLGFYIELVCRYSNRNLTYDQDVLPAFSGVLEALSRRSFLGGFICGLPAVFLDSALLWQPLLKARRRSPVGTATRIAPMAPLPSWSWAGWQCLVDPDSFESGLDYMNWESRPFYKTDPRMSWTTWKLVDWFTFSHDCSINPVNEPALLQSFKAAWKDHNHGSLPMGWSRNVLGAFVHASDPTVSCQYPVPTQNTNSTMVADRNISLLSCTTKLASLRVRRVLVPSGIDTEEQETDGGVAHRWIDTSVFRTDLYNLKPQLHEVCPVITLEDKQGRWAGAMTIMENTSSVQSGSELEMVAISTGSALQSDVAASYPEKIDSDGYWCYRRSSEQYRFKPLDWHGGLDIGAGEGEFSAADSARQSLNSGIDVGPFASCHRPDNTGATVGATASAGSDRPERYHFYNILWVETIDGVMYRKAVGRVPKEVWELNCGEPTKIVLG